MSGNTQVTYVGMIAVGDLLMGNPSVCTLGFTNIPKRKNCLFSPEAIANNFAMLFLFTGNKDEEEFLGETTERRQKLFAKMSHLLWKNDFETLKVYFKNYSECLKAGGYNAIKYYLVLDEGDIDAKLTPQQADEKILNLKAMVEEYDKSKKLPPKKRFSESKEGFQSEECISPYKRALAGSGRAAGTAKIKR